MLQLARRSRRVAARAAYLRPHCEAPALLNVLGTGCRWAYGTARLTSQTAIAS
jgi:hypothetical protein